MARAAPSHSRAYTGVLWGKADRTSGPESEARGLPSGAGAWARSADQPRPTGLAQPRPLASLINACPSSTTRCAPGQGVAGALLPPPGSRLRRVGLDALAIPLGAVRSVPFALSMIVRTVLSPRLVSHEHIEADAGAPAWSAPSGQDAG